MVNIQHMPLWIGLDKDTKGDVIKQRPPLAPYEHAQREQQRLNKEITLSQRSWHFLGIDHHRLSDKLRIEEHKRSMEKTKLLQSITPDKPAPQAPIPQRIHTPAPLVQCGQSPYAITRTVDSVEALLKKMKGNKG